VSPGLIVTEYAMYSLVTGVVAAGVEVRLSAFTLTAIE
jgi:hypothetical protein